MAELNAIEIVRGGHLVHRAFTKSAGCLKAMISSPSESQEASVRGKG
jgi:hypothetical protein